MSRRIFSSFSIRKRLPIKIFGSTVYETIRIPVNPLLALLIMVAEWLIGNAQTPTDRQIDQDNNQENNNE